jgi:SPP1 family predicted phage head-tail adaptor
MPQWPQIDPGKMVHWVNILQQQTVTDLSGQSITWVPFVSAWAAIEPVKGTDVLRGGQDTTKLFLTITIRWQTGILPSMRVQSLNGTYVIQAIENTGERNVILVMTCLGLGANQ